MGRKMQYTTLDRVLSKIYRDLGIEEISETDVVEWSGEALEAIGAVTLYEEAVAFIEIENYQGTLPNGLHSIIQVARNNRWVKENKEDCLCPANIKLDCTTEEIQTVPSKCGCGPTVVGEVHTSLTGDKYFHNGNEWVFMDCNGKLIGDYEIAYYRPYFDLKYEYEGWRNSNIYRQAYTPVRLANNTFFNTLVCPEETTGLYNTCTDEYTIVGDKLRVSFQEGSVAVAYYRQAVDPETGYPMIPDDYSVITAITMYITMKYMGRMWYLGREGFGDKYQKAEQDWHWYCKQAGNRALLPYGIDEHENLKDMRHQLIPQQNRYYGFFGKMSRGGFSLRGI